MFFLSFLHVELLQQKVHYSLVRFFLRDEHFTSDKSNKAFGLPTYIRMSRKYLSYTNTFTFHNLSIANSKRMGQCNSMDSI